MVTKIRKWGNSLGVRLPKSAAQDASVKDGSPVDVRVKNGEIVVRPVKPPKYRLKDLLARIRPGNTHREADFGTPRGREVW